MNWICEKAPLGSRRSPREIPGYWKASLRVSTQVALRRRIYRRWGSRGASTPIDNWQNMLPLKTSIYSQIAKLYFDLGEKQKRGFKFISYTSFCAFYSSGLYFVVFVRDSHYSVEIPEDSCRAEFLSCTPSLALPANDLARVPHRCSKHYSYLFLSSRRIQRWYLRTL